MWEIIQMTIKFYESLKIPNGFHHPHDAPTKMTPNYNAVHIFCIIEYI